LKLLPTHQALDPSLFAGRKGDRALAVEEKLLGIGALAVREVDADEPLR
jgi:hypothetical protein